MPKKKETKKEVTKKELLVSLLKEKMPGCFDREPNSGVNSNVEKLADEITCLLK